MEDPLFCKPVRNRPVTHISLNLPSGMLLSMRVVPDGRDGNVVFGRTLRWGEADDGRGVTVARGEEFTILKGRLVVQLDHIDSLSELGPGGYAPVANTIWTWYQIGPHPDAGVYRALLSLARRVDTAHELWAIAVKQRKEALDTWLGSPSERRLLFRAWGAAEMAVIALHRAARLAEMLARWLDVEVPDDVRGVATSAKHLRDALEHIEERANGMVRGRIEPAALEIFDQGDFIENGRLTYDGHVLDIEMDIIGALLGCRRLIMCVAREKAGRPLIPEADSVRIAGGSES